MILEYYEMIWYYERYQSISYKVLNTLILCVGFAEVSHVNDVNPTDISTIKALHFAKTEFIFCDLINWEELTPGWNTEVGLRGDLRVYFCLWISTTSADLQHLDIDFVLGYSVR